MDNLELTVYVLYPTALAVGLLVGAVLAWALGRRIDSSNPPPQSSALARTAMWLGITAGAAFVLGMIVGMFPALGWLVGTIFPLVAIATSGAATVAAITAIVRRDRRWPAWVGLAAAALPLLNFTAFMIGALITSATS